MRQQRHTTALPATERRHIGIPVKQTRPTKKATTFQLGRAHASHRRFLFACRTHTSGAHVNIEPICSQGRLGMMSAGPWGRRAALRPLTEL